MNREQAKELAPIVKAFGEGSDVQREGQLVKCWYDDDDPSFSATHRWRIKPKPLERWLVVDASNRGTSYETEAEAQADVSHRLGVLAPYRVVHVREVTE